MKHLLVPTLVAASAMLGIVAETPRRPGDTAALSQGSQSVSIILNGPGGRQPRLGMQDFIVIGTDPEQKTAATTVAEVLWKDLDFEEEFLMIPAAESRQIPAAGSITALPLKQWEQLGADFVLTGSVRRAGADLPIDIQVVAVTGPTPGKQVFGVAGHTFTCALAYPRNCAHAISDRLHKELRQLDGVAQTRVAFVSDRTGTIASTAHEGPPKPSKEIFISDYDGENQQAITANRSLNLGPSWSPDGRLIAYWSYGKGAAEPPDIYVKSIYEAKPAWKPAGGPANCSNSEPAFSPDGKQIAFVSNRDGNRQIYIVDTEGKTPARRLSLNKASDGAPTWSYSGNQIAFTSDRAGSGVPLLYVMNANGTAQDALPSPRLDHPSWSPDGALIAFTCGNTSPFNICTFDLHTNKVQEMLPRDGFTNEQPVFAPNGKHIAFITNRYGKDQVAIMNKTGKIQVHVTNTGNNTYPSWSRTKG